MKCIDCEYVKSKEHLADCYKKQRDELLKAATAVMDYEEHCVNNNPKGTINYEAQEVFDKLETEITKIIGNEIREYKDLK